MIADWASYIGIPWESGAQGPDAFDCWSFFRTVQREHFGRDLPVVNVDANSMKTVMQTFQESDKYANWVEVSGYEKLKNGGAVLMSQSRYPSHVGIWIDVDGGGVIHCVHGSGVIFSSMTSLQKDGWSNIRLYNYENPE